MRIEREPKMNTRPDVSDLDATETGLRARLEWWGADLEAREVGSVRVINGAVEPCHVALALVAEVKRLRSARVDPAALWDVRLDTEDAIDDVRAEIGALFISARASRHDLGYRIEHLLREIDRLREERDELRAEVEQLKGELYEARLGRDA